jgi:hypothetical protein
LEGEGYIGSHGERIGEFANKKVISPTDPKDLDAHELKDMKSRRIILDVMKDNLIPHISEKKSAREMFVAPRNLFQSNNTNRKMVLREKLKDTKMTKFDTMTTYLTKIT